MTGSTTGTLLIGSDTPQVQQLRAALEAEFLESAEFLQSAEADSADLSASAHGAWPWADSYESWRAEASEGEEFARVVVACWAAQSPSPTPLVSLDHKDWLMRHEEPLARWFSSLGAASRRCGDNGSIVAVIERAAPLDCGGRAAETGLSDAVEAMVRSLARSEGHRGVRVNAVTTPIALVPERLVEPAPPLSRFPGTIDQDVAGAVRLLLSEDAIGITGSILDAASGRAWR